jgi:hypothetical protein
MPNPPLAHKRATGAKKVKSAKRKSPSRNTQTKYTAHQAFDIIPVAIPDGGWRY